MKKSEKSLNPCQSVIQTIYDIVKAHGGILRIASTSNTGTTFIIELPKEDNNG